MGQSRCGLEPLARTLSEEETVASGKGWGENQDKSDEDHDHNHDYDAGESPLRGLHETRNPLAASRPERNQVPLSSLLPQSTSWSVLLSLSSSSLCFHSDFHRHRQAPDHHLQVMVLMIRRLLWRCWWWWYDADVHDCKNDVCIFWPDSSDYLPQAEEGEKKEGQDGNVTTEESKVKSQAVCICIYVYFFVL